MSTQENDIGGIFGCRMIHIFIFLFVYFDLVKLFALHFSAEFTVLSANVPSCIIPFTGNYLYFLVGQGPYF